MGLANRAWASILHKDPNSRLSDWCLSGLRWCDSGQSEMTMPLMIYITMRWHEHHDFYSDWQYDSLFSSLFRLISKKTLLGQKPVDSSHKGPVMHSFHLMMSSRNYLYVIWDMYPILVLFVLFSLYYKISVGLWNLFIHILQGSFTGTEPY